MKDKRYYGLCPANVATGGTELMHQFVDYINTNTQIEAFIVYYNSDSEFVNSEIPERFKVYNIKLVNKIDDVAENIVIVPETSLYLAKKFEAVNYLFWWMSFDNYFNNSNLFDYFKFYTSGQLSIKQLLLKIYYFKFDKVFTFNDIEKIKNRVIHCYQSQYAHHKLYDLGIYNQLPLSDYINASFIKDETNRISSRENIILYNPAKGFEITKRIIKKLPQFQFLPLVGLNAAQVADLFSKAKLYIDFGNHPGKDRMPREAALQGCVILIGKRGSARYLEDVNIHRDNKMEVKDIDSIVDRINELMNNFEVESKNMEHYVELIRNEKEIFENEIKMINKAIDVLFYTNK